MTNNETHSESKFGPVEKVSGNLYIDEMLRNVEMFFAVADAQGPEGRLPGTRERPGNGHLRCTGCCCSLSNR